MKTDEKKAGVRSAVAAENTSVSSISEQPAVMGFSRVGETATLPEAVAS